LGEADIDLESLQVRQNEEVAELNRRYDQEISDLRSDLDEDSRNQAAIQSAAGQASGFAHEFGGDLIMDTPELLAAKDRAWSAGREVEVLEAELRRITREQQARAVEQAKLLRDANDRRCAEERDERSRLRREKERDFELEVSDLKDELKKDLDGLKDRLRRQEEKNRKLEIAMAESRDQIAEGKQRSKRARELAKENEREVRSARVSKSNRKSFFGEFSPVDTEIIRLRDENEELHRILRNLDHLVYDANK
jgi:hypothetical protein